MKIQSQKTLKKKGFTALGLTPTRALCPCECVFALLSNIIGTDPCMNKPTNRKAMIIDGLNAGDDTKTYLSTAVLQIGRCAVLILDVLR